MDTLFDLASLRQVISQWKKEGRKIAFVPTMGNLHAGHLSLLKHAHSLGDRTIMSIFVNPIQFGENEDYQSYPDTLEQDSKTLKENSLDVLFAPDLKEMYPGGMNVDTRLTVPGLSSILCGEFRPDHFSGVATVVTKLFINIEPDYALFGEKDYQQLLIIRRTVEDLCFPVEVIGMPVVREEDGLAMSSRNSYLDEEQRKIAPLIYQTLTSAAELLSKNLADISAIESEGLNQLESAGFKPEYFSIRRSSDLIPAGPDDKEVSILTAVWLGSARLIDNIKVAL